MGFYYEDIRARYAVPLHTEHTTVSTYFTIPDSHRRGTGHNDLCAARWTQHPDSGGQYFLELIYIAAACTCFQ